jgi:hypothetical protein
VDGVDDLGGVDPIEVDRGDTKVDVPELALDHVEPHALAGHLDGMCVAKLVRGEAAADASRCSDAAEMVASGGACPGSSAGLAVDDADSVPTGISTRRASQGWSAAARSLTHPPGA